MPRPPLREIPLEDAVAGITGKGRITVTMSVGQWDAFLSGGYDRGFVLLELDDDEIPVHAYQKELPSWLN